MTYRGFQVPDIPCQIGHFFFSCTLPGICRLNRIVCGFDSVAQSLQLGLAALPLLSFLHKIFLSPSSLTVTRLYCLHLRLCYAISPAQLCSPSITSPLHATSRSALQVTRHECKQPCRAASSSQPDSLTAASSQPDSSSQPDGLIILSLAQHLSCIAPPRWRGCNDVVL